MADFPSEVSSPGFISVPTRVKVIANPGTPDQELLNVLLNPPDLRETIQVEWNRLPVIGLDHEIAHYGRTRSIEYPLTFFFSAYEAANRLENFENTPARSNGAIAGDVREVKNSSMHFANFWRSLCFPTKSGLRPPSVQIVWPNVFNLIGVITSLNMQYHKFDRTLTPIIYQADVMFLETRISRRFSEEVRQSGLNHTELTDRRG